jgi:hypothetical protein
MQIPQLLCRGFLQEIHAFTLSSHSSHLLPGFRFYPQTPLSWFLGEKYTHLPQKALYTPEIFFSFVVVFEQEIHAFTLYFHSSHLLPGFRYYPPTPLSWFFGQEIHAFTKKALYTPEIFFSLSSHSSH